MYVKKLFLHRVHNYFEAGGMKIRDNLIEQQISYRMISLNLSKLGKHERYMVMTK